MSRTINTAQDLNEYARGLLANLRHHGKPVMSQAAYLLLSLFAHADTGSIEAYEREGTTKNMVWFRIRGERFCASKGGYDSDGHVNSIEIRRQSISGHSVAVFTEASSFEDVDDAVRALRRS